MEHKAGIYEKYIKRLLDIVLSLCAIIVLSPVMLITALLVRIKLGSPVIFCQQRPGKIDSKTGKEKIFKMYKFRSMTDARDEDGELLPDEVRLTKFGKALRSTSLDELPELFNILKGDMSIVGPRPQLVRDMVFMSAEQRQRHLVRQGLTGLAQINGRNAIDWEEKLEWDLRYIEELSFLLDVRIVIGTVGKVFIKREGITQGDMATAEDFGDYLLYRGKIGKERYNEKQLIAKKILQDEI